MDRTCLLVVCGAPVARRATDLAAALTGVGFALRVAVTEAAEGWVDQRALEAVAGAPVRFVHRSADDPKAGPSDVVLVCPATFNTVNKLAAGVADTYVASTLAESLGQGIPMVVVPMVNDKLWATRRGSRTCVCSPTPGSGCSIRRRSARGLPRCVRERGTRSPTPSTSSGWPSCSESRTKVRVAHQCAASMPPCSTL